MLNLDPALLDQDAIRLRRRKRLLIAAAVPFMLLFVLFVFLIRTTIYNISYSNSVNGGGYTTAEFFADSHKIVNLIDPYIAYYDKGYVLLSRAENKTDLQEAQSEFQESLKYNPPESMLCSIYGNFSYAIELQADLEFKEGDYNSSVVNYNRAESLLYENGCVSKNNDESKDRKSEEAKDRVESKRRKAIAAANNTTDDGNNNGSSSGGQQISDDQLKNIIQGQDDVEWKTIQGIQSNRARGAGSGGSINNSDTPNF